MKHKPAAPKERLDLYIPHGNMVVSGKAVAIRGVTSDHKPQKIVLEADPYPFDSFHTIAARMAGRHGRYVFTVRPTRNTRYRLSSGDGRQGPSAPETVYAFPKSNGTADWAAPGLVNFSETYHVAPGLRYHPTPIFFYVRQPGTDTLHLKGHATLRRESSTTLVARAQLNIGSSNAFNWITCTRRSPVVGMGTRPRHHGCGTAEVSWRAVHDGAVDFY